ncbi:MAG: glycerol-3-phosphate acyltransferase [Clostridia bacterium]|nr:glycerol-3-phosphate acyltransferase [Clostridia bacterium]
MKLGLSLFVVAFLSYFIGTINFAKIISWNARRKDITKIGSKNPGTMNMLRSHGFGLALATFICEIAKAGLTCLLSKLAFEFFDMAAYGDIAYFTAGLFIVLGYDFPVWSKFKGGKGVAVFAGVFLFSHLWYAAIGWFVLCFVLLIIIDIGSVVSFTYTGGLAIGYTFFAWFAGLDLVVSIVITAVVWFLYILMLIKHHANIKRLFTGTENKVGFKDKIRKMFSHKKGEQIIDEEQVENKPEEEIVVQDNEEK